MRLKFRIRSDSCPKFFLSVLKFFDILKYICTILKYICLFHITTSNSQMILSYFFNNKKALGRPKGFCVCVKIYSAATTASPIAEQDSNVVPSS